MWRRVSRGRLTDEAPAAAPFAAPAPGDTGRTAVSTIAVV